MTHPVASTVTALQVEVENARALSFDGEDAAVLAWTSAALGRLADPASGEQALLQARILKLRTASLTRLGRFSEALATYAGLPSGETGRDWAQARATMLADMAYRCIAMEAPPAGLPLADAAFRLALVNELPAIASDALSWVSFCHGNQGQLEPSERFLLEALGIALQSGDDATVHGRLSNLLQLSHLLHDACLNRGDADAAEHVMKRSAKLVNQGERLAASVGIHERGAWRVYRAGWLRRRGRLELAGSECASVLVDAESRGWLPLERLARFEAAHVWQEEGRIDAAVDALRRVIETPTTHDSYHLDLRAHRRLEKLFTAQNRVDDAQHHHALYQQLLDRRRANRADVAHALPKWGTSVLDALAEADRLRIDAEAERLRVEQTDVRQQRFLATN